MGPGADSPPAERSGEIGSGHGRAPRARANFEEAGLGDATRVVEEDAPTALASDDGRFDVCFNDLLTSFDSEESTERTFRLCLERLRPGGLLMAENALRQGEVLEPTTVPARNVARYNRLVATHPRLESVIVPIRDGLSVARVRD
ncbi:MAG: O-methyltransferase [Candidatus Dormibacteraceae bacterium]